MRKKTELLTGPQIDQLISMAETFQQFCLFLADFFGIFKKSLQEIKRVGAALKKAQAPPNFEDVLSDITDDYVRELLGRATLVKFELGRLVIQAEDSFDANHLKLFKGSIIKALNTRYGVSHTVKVFGPVSR